MTSPSIHRRHDKFDMNIFKDDLFLLTVEFSVLLAPKDVLVFVLPRVKSGVAEDFQLGNHPQAQQILAPKYRAVYQTILSGMRIVQTPPNHRQEWKATQAAMSKQELLLVHKDMQQRAE